MAYRIEPFPMTFLSDLQTHSPIENLFKCDFLYNGCAVLDKILPGIEHRAVPLRQLSLLLQA